MLIKAYCRPGSINYFLWSKIFNPHKHLKKKVLLPISVYRGESGFNKSSDSSKIRTLKWQNPGLLTLNTGMDTLDHCAGPHLRTA